MVNMKRTAAVAAALFCTLAGSEANASSTGPSTVTVVLSATAGFAMFEVDGQRSPRPSCGAAFPTRFAFNTTTPAGQAMLSTLLTAATAHKSIVVWGSGACDQPTPDTEGVLYIEMRP